MKETIGINNKDLIEKNDPGRGC